MMVNLRAATPQDADFVYQVLRATMRAYVEQTWGWDEGWQHAYFHMRFEASKNQIVVLNGQDIGVLSAERQAESGIIHLSSLYILPDYQGQGIGTQLLSDLLAAAFDQGLAVTLRVLKVNPAKRLYERLGFVVVDEDDVRYVMKAETN